MIVQPDRDASIYHQDDRKQGRLIYSQGITFDRFLEDQRVQTIDLLKVDIEGAELELFDSLMEKNLNFIKQVTVEFHDFLWPEMHGRVEAIKRKMISNGYYCIQFSLDNSNVLFVRKELIAHSTYLNLKYFYKYSRGILRKIKRIV